MKIAFMKMIKNITAKSTFALAVAWIGLVGCKDNFTNPTAPSGATITTVASTTDSLKVYYAALNKIGQASTFNNVNSGQFTVFAPSNYAFVKYLRSLSVPNSSNFTTDSAVKYISNKVTTTSSPLTISALTTRLNYHVISTAVTTDQITGAKGFTTQQGARLSLSNVAGASLPYQINANVTSSGGGSGSNIIVTDLKASNGVIQVVDRVMAPISTANIWNSSLLNFGVTYGASVAVTIGTTTIPLDAGDSYYNVAAAPNGSTASDTTKYFLFTMALVRSGLATTIIPNGASILPDYTVFAPTDGAFFKFLGTDLSGGVAAAYTAARTAINSTDGATLANIVKYHIVSGRYLSTDLSDGKTLTTLLTDKTVKVVSKNSAWYLSGNVASTGDGKISAPDKLTNAGIVHSIQRVQVGQ
ncbi:MAG TPA: hypothetical protein DGG95_10960 [Cytophagales bacterium]|jgi:transforming growth factor-beta-induced protein|nr:hypothetical protein [Cytophagales bacterium]